MILDHENGLFLMRNDHLGERNWRSDGCYKIIFSPYGKGIYQTRRRDVSIDSGNFLIFNPNEEHKQLQVAEEKFLVEMEQPLLIDVAEQLGLNVSEPEFALLPFKNPHILNWITFIREYINVSSNALFIENSLTQLAILMLQNGPGSHLNQLPEVTGELDNVINALQESYDEEWSLEEMATVAGLNKFQFAHTFKSKTGLSPYSWLQLYRLIRSQHFLTYTEETVLSIALKVGFKNIASYNSLFKKIYGKTPTEFRMFHRKNS
ncbi:helix-turn-helix domain-containing protein [Virgibacillus doumboii]|uniref:helix-turn-helix domain-containing protein n=1 Tax=Virgibacillus doumboii TaxID=2697503 RepID=UPI0013DF622F|nr:AraC family transcriptional regulator [Virgibacillus doumboii]